MHPILADRRRLQIYLAAWMLVGGMVGLLVRAVLGVDWTVAMLFGPPLGLVAAPMSLSAWYLARAMPIARTPLPRIAATSAGAAFVTAGIWAAVGAWWWRALGQWGVETGAAAEPALIALVIGVGALGYLVALSAQYALAAFEESLESGRRVLRSEVAQRDAELTALRAQVDPHFLFNSLNSISGLIGADPDKARQMCQLLGEFLRDSLALGSSARIPLSREIRLAEQYLGVEQIRFGRRLITLTEITEACGAVLVPPLILQPLVENAVRHGIATCLDGGTVAITARVAGARAVVQVSNPRDKDDIRRGTGFGLGIVRRRLSASYGDLAALVLEPGDTSYRATLTLPLEGETHARP